MEHVENPYSIPEPSKWWLKSLAIFMSIMIFLMLFQIVSGVLTPILINQVPRDFNELEIYPENGTEQEINDWEESNEFWNETIDYLDQFKIFSKFYVIYGIILFFLGLTSVGLFNSFTYLALVHTQVINASIFNTAISSHSEVPTIVALYEFLSSPMYTSIVTAPPTT